LTIVQQNKPFKVSCRTSTDYEWCTFYHNSKKCEFEWKRASWNITATYCDSFAQRIKFSGDYKSHICAIEMEAAKEDTGEWICELEEYVRGGHRGSGKKVTGMMEVYVHSQNLSYEQSTCFKEAVEKCSVPRTYGSLHVALGNPKEVVDTENAESSDEEEADDDDDDVDSNWSEDSVEIESDKTGNDYDNQSVVVQEGDNVGNNTENSEKKLEPLGNGTSIVEPDVESTPSSNDTTGTTVAAGKIQNTSDDNTVHNETGSVTVTNIDAEDGSKTQIKVEKGGLAHAFDVKMKEIMRKFT